MCKDSLVQEFSAGQNIGGQRFFTLVGYGTLLLLPAIQLLGQETWVVTLAVDRCAFLGDKDQLQYCSNDTVQILERLRNRNRIAVDDRILSIRSDAMDSNCTPTRENIVRELPKFIARAALDDTIIVFAAAHGVRLQNRDTGAFEGFLLPADADPRIAQESLISLEWLRSQLLRSQAQTIVLFLDTCHAGSVGTEVTSRLQKLSTRDVERVFHQAATDPLPARKAFYTLVSCGDDERSLEWKAFQQGVFAYWLCQGLDGAADIDGDAIVSMDELFRFVEREVPRTAAFLGGKSGVPLTQQPQRFLLGAAHGDLKLFPLHAEPARKTFDRLVDLLDAVTKNHVRNIAVDGRIPRISVLEFRLRMDQERKLRGSLGSLGVIARDVVERGLLDRISVASKDAAAYSVVSEETLRPSLRGVDFEAVLAGRLPPAAQDEATAQVDAFILGTFSRRGHQPGDPAPDRLCFEVQVFDVHQTAPVGRIGITMLVDEELWSLLGGSRDERQLGPQSPAGPLVAETVLNLPDLAPAPQVTAWNEEARQSHPLRESADSTLGVTIHCGRPRQPKRVVEWLPTDPDLVDDNVLSFPVRAGDEIEIRIANQTDQWLAVVTLVDGYNVIGRGRTLPSDARYWLWPPRRKGVIDQWLDGETKTLASSERDERQRMEGRKLLVTNPPSSVAGQKGFTGDLGEIRLLVFGTVDVPPDEISRVAGGQQSLGIGEGTQSANAFPLYRHKRIDSSRQLATYVIHYLDTDLFALRP